jgi:CRP-like cAMP-binding protein
MTEPITLEQILHFLLEAPMFGDLDPAELSEIVRVMQVQKLRPGQYVFREGDPGDAWYVLYEGEVEVLKEGLMNRQPIANLGPRQCFGEMAILDGFARSASVRATSEGTAFRFPRVEFAGLLNAGNLAAYKLVHQIALVLVARQRETTARLVEAMTTETLGEVLGEIVPIVGTSAVAE